MATYEELVEKVARVIEENPAQYIIQRDSAGIVISEGYSVTSTAKAAIATVLEALSELSDAMNSAGYDAYYATSDGLNHGTSLRAAFLAALAASPLVEEERR